MTATALLLLADGRFPGGGHAHSGGLEAAVASGAVTDLPSFESFLAGRLLSLGGVDSWLAAAACAGADPLVLDAEADARCPSPALRLASRRLGRGLRRAAAAAWPSLTLGRATAPPGGEDACVACTTVPSPAVAEHHAVVQGLVARAAGLSVRDAAALPGASFLAGAAAAVVRLLPIDTADAMAVCLGLSALADRVAEQGARHATCSPVDAPAGSAPLLDLRAEDHARWPERGEVRLFAS